MNTTNAELHHGVPPEAWPFWKSVTAGILAG
jgi:hypothetical protein